MKSQIDYLSEALEIIKLGMFELIDHSRILQFKNDPSSGVNFITPEFYWDGPTLEEQQIQIELKRKYLRWIELFKMIIEDAPESVKAKILEVDSFIMNWIEKSREWGLPETLQEAKTKFEEVIIPLYDILKQYSDSENKSIILIPDTSALISKSDPLAYKNCINQEKFTFAILPAVLSKLEELKMESWDIAFRNRVRSVIKRLNGFRNKGNLHEGIKVHKTIVIKMYAIEPDFTKALSWLDKDNNDDKIIASAIEIQRANPSDYVIIATSDINLINKAEMAYFPYVEFD